MFYFTQHKISNKIKTGGCRSETSLLRLQNFCLNLHDNLKLPYLIRIVFVIVFSLNDELWDIKKVPNQQIKGITCTFLLSE